MAVIPALRRIAQSVAFEVEGQWYEMDPIQQWEIQQEIGDTWTNAKILEVCKQRFEIDVSKDPNNKVLYVSKRDKSRYILREKIIIMLDNTPKKASEIRSSIGGGITKKDVNRILYALQAEGLATRDDEFQWTMGPISEVAAVPSERELAQMLLRARDGDNEARGRFQDAMARGQVSKDLGEFYVLTFTNDIYVDSPESKRLQELSKKYDCDEIWDHVG